LEWLYAELWRYAVIINATTNVGQITILGINRLARHAASVSYVEGLACVLVKIVQSDLNLNLSFRENSQEIEHQTQL
jgi:hypothetical protein